MTTCMTAVTAGIMLACAALPAAAQTYQGVEQIATPGKQCGKVMVGGTIVGVEWADGFSAAGLWATALQFEGSNVTVQTRGMTETCLNGDDQSAFNVPKIYNISRTH